MKQQAFSFFIILILNALFGYAHEPVISSTLKNGLTVLVKEIKNSQKVSLRLWYKAGSRDEVEDQRGIAHLLEHMLFKGTEKLSATDIDLSAHKLGAHFNAYTSTDHTRMVFDVPVQHWRVIMSILADCMNNCTLKQEHLNSEFKVVLSEFKRSRDNHESQLAQEMSKILYADHPYSHPVIGYKKDICSINSQELKAFYETFYVPNNAILIVAGNIDAKEVFAVADKEFGSIEAKPVNARSFSTQSRALPQTVEIHRDIALPVVSIAFKTPSFFQDAHLKMLPLIDNILFNQESGRIVKKLRDELQLVNSIGTNHEDLLDCGIYWIEFDPRSHEKSSFKTIIDLIQEELDRLADIGYTQEEIETACESFDHSRNECLAYNACQAEIIAEGYYHMGDPNFAYTVSYKPEDDFKHDMQTFIKTYLKASNSCIGYLLPSTEEEKRKWRLEQEAEELQDKKILAERPHSTSQEEGKYAQTLSIDRYTHIEYPQPQSFTLSNGLKVLYYHSDHVPTIECGLDFKISGSHKIEEPKEVFSFMSKLLKEGGTERQSSHEFKKLLARHAFSLSSAPGKIRGSLPSKSLPLFLNLLGELLAMPAFDGAELAKIKEWAKQGYRDMLDDESSLAHFLQRDLLIGDSAFAHKNEKSISDITRQALVKAYTSYISPDGAVLAIVGDLSTHPDLQTLLENTLGQWKGNAIADRPREKAQDTPYAHTMYHYLDRDQVYLSLAKASVSPESPEFLSTALYTLFLNEKLFTLREKTGMFYAINAHLSNPTAQIVTQVSPENLSRVHSLLLESLNTYCDACTQEELEQAKNYLLESLQHGYASNGGLLEIFLYLEKNHLPFDRAEFIKKLEELTLNDFKKDIKKLFPPSAFNTVVVGRVCPPNTCSHLINTKRCSLLMPNTTVGSFDRSEPLW